MTEQGDEEVLTVQRHVIWPVGLTPAQEVEHLCRDGFNPVQVQLLDALMESDDLQDADSLRRQVGVACDVLRPTGKPTGSRSRKSVAFWG
jgi:hypothetical protein